MIFNLRLLPTVLGITISLGVAWPILLGQQHLAVAKSTKKFKARSPLPQPSSADTPGQTHQVSEKKNLSSSV
jgi:hypothetical protein